MIWVWIIIAILTLLTVFVKKSVKTIGFFISSIITLISFLIINNFFIQLGIFVVVGVLCIILINKYYKKDKIEK